MPGKRIITKKRTWKTGTLSKGIGTKDGPSNVACHMRYVAQATTDLSQ